ncbi:hypothetical protein AU194_15970 [Mycobacterium sp. GA-2829]|nr:hypothetical protein AU194_15970 [Mycobacterium sp. GA-2829]
MHLFDLPHEKHAPRIKSVSGWILDATEITVVFSEAVLPAKRVTRDDEVTAYYLRPFNPAS